MEVKSLCDRELREIRRGWRCDKTNPIPGGAGRGEAPGAWDAGQMRKTNPIWPWHPGMGAVGRESKGRFVPLVVVRTKPIPEGAASRKC
jgi:hypothetical protein